MLGTCGAASVGKAETDAHIDLLCLHNGRRDDRRGGDRNWRARAEDQRNAGRWHRRDGELRRRARLYTVSGSLDHAEHHVAHERVLETLTAPDRVEGGNEMPVGVLEG
jgi:hypothetical protein